MSASGALITSTLPLPLHTTVLVQIEAADAHQPFCRLALAGEIARITDEGFAVEWAEFAPHTLRAILRALEKRRAPPAHPKLDVR